jgi:mannose-6-phosphate isomerase
MEKLTQPLTFEPIFMERIWGGRALESHFGKKLPSERRIGESWEIADRPEAQSVVRNGPLKGKTLHELWTGYRTEIFGGAPESPSSPRRVFDRTVITRFPLLIKLLDARETLSLQVHPPADAAERLGGEAKTEFWYVANAEPGAKLHVGLRKKISSGDFRRALDAGNAADHLHVIQVKSGDSMFLPSGRFHAVGGGNLLVEVQQNSDTTYRVFDWNRVDDSGKPRQLHIEQAMDSINFDDVTPALVKAEGEQLIRHELFEVQKWNLNGAREIGPRGQFTVVVCLTGRVSNAGLEIGPGDFMLVPASLADRSIEPGKDGASILRVTIPG